MNLENSAAAGGEHAYAYRVLRYTPNLLRDEWVNIGVLVFDPETGERALAADRRSRGICEGAAVASAGG